MATSNRGGVIPFARMKRELKKQMDAYDALPPDIRKALQEAPYNLNILPGKYPSAAQVRASANRAKIAAIYHTYGPNHPEYQRSL